jgi:undecaprenyl-phosphate 4-deoxy-4-formamido-L-arabinose transferase
MDCSVVIPVYNSEDTLPELLERLAAVLPRVAKQYEVILVNDGSRDRSWQVIQGLCATHPWLRGIDLMRNYGQGNALLRGIHAARYEVTVTMDDDLQNPPEEIPLLLSELEQGYDIVYGYSESEGHDKRRTFASRLIKRIMRLIVKAPGIERSGPFRAFLTALREGFARYKNPYVSIDVLISWSTTKYGYVPVRHEQRKAGRSNYTFGKLVTHTLNLLLGFSTLPLRLASWLGFTITLFGVGVFLYVIGRMLLFGSPVQGFTFLASIISIFSGVQLFSLGIIGEYLARMYVQMMSRPVYTVRSEIGNDSRHDA